MKVERTQNNPVYLKQDHPEGDFPKVTEKVNNHIPERIMQATCAVAPMLLPVGPAAIIVYPFFIAGFLYASYKIRENASD